MFDFVIKKIKQFIRRPFIQDLIGLEINAFAYTVIVGAASIVLARFLGRDQYGLYVLAFAMAGLLGQAFQLGNSQTLVTLLSEGYGKKSKDEIVSAIGWYLKVNLATVFPLTALIFFAAGPIAQYGYHKPELTALVRMIIIVSLVSGLLQLITIIFQAARHIRGLVLIETGDIFLKKVFMVGAAVAGFGLFWVMFGQLAGAILGLGIAFLSYRAYRAYDSYLPSFSEIMNAARRVSFRKYLWFDLAIAFERMVNSGFALLPPLLLGMVASSGDVALFSIAYGYMFLPGLFLTPISRMLSVVLPQSHQISSDPWKKFLYSGFLSGVLMFLGVVALLVAAPFLLPLLYGERYRLSADLARQLFFAAAFVGAGAGLGGMIRALRKNVFFTIGNFIVMIAGVLIFEILYWVGISTLCAVIVMITFWNAASLIFSYVFIRIFFGTKNGNNRYFSS